MRTSGAFLWVLCSASVVACNDPDPSGAQSTGAQSTEVAEGEGSSIDIADQSVVDAARTVATASRLPIAIDPGASEVARCARVTLIAPSPATPDGLVRLFGDALGGSGLMVERTGDGAVVRRVAGAPAPPGCAGTVDDGPAETGADSATARGGARADSIPPIPDRGRQVVEDGIRAAGGNQFLVTEEAIDAALADPTRLGGGRVAPVLEDGRTTGVRVTGLRATSAAYRMGIRNGDIIRSVNGQSLDNPATALMALTNIRAQRQATIVLDREGQARTLHWRTVDSL
jgi:hypothetical protein